MQLTSARADKYEGCIWAQVVENLEESLGKGYLVALKIRKNK
jgi:hypothetical protein